ncbi:MAG: PKD domain-containing protein, partial [Candidatus Eisenbacteria bacterium]
DAQTVTLSQTNTAAFLAGPASAGPSLNPSITLTGTPNFTQAGSSSVNWSAADATTGTASATTAISIANVDRPVVLNTIANITVAEGASASTAVNASDPDGDAIGLTASLPGFATLNAPVNGAGSVVTSVTAAPGFSDAGSYSASVTATVLSPASSATQNFTITVSNTNRPVVLAAIADLTVAEGASATRNVSASDADGDAISLNATGVPAFASFTDNLNGTGALTASPGFSDAGTYPIAVTATSADLTTDSKSFNLIVTGTNQAPTMTQPAAMTVNEGASATQQLVAGDPDFDLLTFSKVGTTPFFMSVSTSGLVTLAPGFTDAGGYTGTVRVSDGSATDTKSFAITVVNVNRCPTANAGGPYSGVITIPVAMTGAASSDPDGDALTYNWDFGDGGPLANGALVSHIYALAGNYTVTLTVSDTQCTGTATTTASIVAQFAANAFTVGGNSKTSLVAGKPFTCFQIEALGGSFNVSNVDLSSIVMISAGTGSVSQISAVAGKTVVDGDRNGINGTEITACFSKADLRLIFSSLPAGNNTVLVTLEGNLTTGGRFHAELNHVVKGTGGALAASISPNPMNPAAKLTFSISKPGAVKVQMFDLNGRLVRTLLDERNVAAGYSDVTIDGRTNTGSRIASGIYFVKITTEFDGVVTKALTVLK